MKGGEIMNLTTIMENVTSLTTGLTTMFASLSQYWFVFLPVTFTVFGFLFGKFKSILMYKRGRRRSGM